MSRLFRRLIALVLVGLSVGCGTGGSTAPPITIAAPHGGFLTGIPGGKGFVEFLSDVVVPGGRGKVDQTILVIYFLTPDGKSAISPPPSNVSFNLSSNGAADPVVVTATPKDQADPTDPGRFASPLGSYSAGSEIQGELSATVDGAIVKVPIFAR